MEYEKAMEQAAKRHFDDAAIMLEKKRYDNAGYHYGFAAECALKHSLREIGVRDDDDSIWKHFPRLKHLALLAVQSRRAGPLRQILESPQFMQGWQIDMRYSKNGSVDSATVEKWRNDANEALALLY